MMIAGFGQSTHRVDEGQSTGEVATVHYRHDGVAVAIPAQAGQPGGDGGVI